MPSAQRSPSWPGRPHRETGVALVFVLWLMVLLSAVALEMAYRGHLRVQVTATTGETAKAFYLARAGVEQAMADLAEGAQRQDKDEALREDSEELYRNVQLGEGTFTLYAGMDEQGEAHYGLMDESGKLNILAVDATVLQKLPGMTPELAAALVNGRKQVPYRDLKDLLAIEGFDVLILFGEDQNENGLLDANENDGDETWPPDDADGTLDRGLAAYLTTWSASRNVSSDGEERVNLNKDDAEEITRAIKDISQQQADSIVARRQNGDIGSVLDLLDVDLVEKVVQQSGQPGGQQNDQGNQGGQNGNNAQGQSQDAGKKDSDKKSDKTEDDGKDQGKKESGEQPQAGQEGQKKQEQGVQYRSTGQKAFDEDALRKIADRLTTSDDDTLAGLVNVNTASYEVLACLPGFDESLAQGVVNARDRRAGGFTAVVDLLDVGGITMDILKQVYPLLTVRSDVYTARSFGVMNTGSARACVSAVLDRTEDEVRIRYWQEPN